MAPSAESPRSPRPASPSRRSRLATPHRRPPPPRRRRRRTARLLPPRMAAGIVSCRCEREIVRMNGTSKWPNNKRRYRVAHRKHTSSTVRRSRHNTAVTMAALSTFPVASPAFFELRREVAKSSSVFEVDSHRAAPHTRAPCRGTRRCATCGARPSGMLSPPAEIILRRRTAARRPVAAHGAGGALAGDHELRALDDVLHRRLALVVRPSRQQRGGS